MPDIDLGLILAAIVCLVIGLLLGFGITALYFKKKISKEQKQLEEDKAKSQDNANIYLANAQKEAEKFIAYNKNKGWSCLPNWKDAADLWATRIEEK